MRLHRLTMTGIGPYAGTEVIDFDRFADSGRFLLTGPTGAGKSTIIDAIVFALYGHVADKDGSSRQRIRSTLVEPSARSEVELVFSTSAGTFRILRSPDYQRPKLRGAGMTSEKASVRMWRLASADGAPLAEPLTRFEEVGQEVLRVVGLNRDQLTQTVVLPQGRFAQFLRASSAERHDLLRDVFGTGVYDDLQKELQERGRAVQREADAARDTLRARAGVLGPLLDELEARPGPAPTGAVPPTPEAGTGAATGPAEAGATATGATAAGAATATSLRGTLNALVESRQVDAPSIARLGATAVSRSSLDLAPLEEAVEVAGRERDAASRRLEETTDLAGRLQRRADLLDEQERLDASRSRDEEEAELLDAARRAARVTTALAAAQRARQGALDATVSARAALSLETAGTAHDRERADTVQAPQDGAASALFPAEAAGAATEQRLAVLGGPEALRAGEALDGLVSLSEADLVERRGEVADPARTGASLGTAVSPGAAPHAERAPWTEALGETITLLRLTADDSRTEAGALAPLVSTEAGLPSRDQQLGRRRADLVAHSEAVALQETTLRERPTEHDALQRRLDAARQAQSELPALRVAADASHARLEAGRRAVALGEQVAAATSAVEKAREAARRAGGLVSSKRDAWLTATASSLVAELRDGEPCPVCGSLEHPDPAQSQPGSVSRADVETAERAQKTADDAFETAVRHRTDLARRREEALASAGGGDVAELVAAAAADAQHLEQRERDAQPHEDLTEAVTGFAARTEELRHELDTARDALTAERARLEADEAALVADRASCQAERHGHPSVSARAAATAQRADAADALASVIERAVDGERVATDASVALASALQEAGFTSALTARDAALTAPELAALESAVAATAARRERVTHGLTQDESIAALTGEESADVPAARERLTEAGAALDGAVRSLAEARAAHRTLEAAARAVEEAAAALARAIGGSVALATVVDLASGRNDASTPLATWVLLERFTSVLSFANARLAEMSDGRYELVRVDDEAGSAGRRDRGLGLGVVDVLAGGAVRDPRTLSGGETFYVSLSLALALADVVTAESGGITMETLFVDEGFGSLDPETLQKVLGELGRLQAGGRTVGIVSHVEELRRQVPDRVEVRKAPTGSTLRIVAS